MRGSEEKLIVTNGILKAFDGAFIYDKDIRIPINGVEIKIALTCAKENVGGAPAETNAFDKVDGGDQAPAAPTEDELQNVKNFMEALGM